VLKTRFEKRTAETPEAIRCLSFCFATYRSLHRRRLTRLVRLGPCPLALSVASSSPRPSLPVPSSGARPAVGGAPSSAARKPNCSRLRPKARRNPVLPATERYRRPICSVNVTRCASPHEAVPPVSTSFPRPRPPSPPTIREILPGSKQSRSTCSPELPSG